MFVRTNTDAVETLVVKFEGRDIEVRAGLSVAAALLESGIGHFRETPVSNSPRAPFCMMGACFECLLEIDGIENQRACQVEVKTGMQVRRQLAVSGGEAS